MRSTVVRIRAFGSPEVLELEERPVRTPAPTEVVVRVVAAGLNRADLLQRRGAYPAPPGVPPDVPGLEYSGEVIALGSDVDAAWLHRRVMGIVGGGAMSMHVVVDQRELIPVPEALSYEQAAAIPEAFVTAYDALFIQGTLGVGEQVVVHAVGSGVGTAALMLAAHAGARVYGTSRSAHKLARAAEYAPFEAIHCADTFSSETVLAKNSCGVDLVVDLVGGAYLAENLRVLCVRGRLVLVGLVGGREASLPLGTVLAKRLTLRGTVLRSRSPEEKRALVADFSRRIVPLFENGELTPVVDDVLPMHDVRAAHERMESNDTFGKLVLVW